MGSQIESQISNPELEEDLNFKNFGASRERTSSPEREFVTADSLLKTIFFGSLKWLSN
jgi:hypothetical protein